MRITVGFLNGVTAARFARRLIRASTGDPMKISESEFRRLHFKSRTLDKVCRAIWPENKRPLPAVETLLLVEDAIGDYRPGPQAGVSGVNMLRASQDALDKAKS